MLAVAESAENTAVEDAGKFGENEFTRDAVHGSISEKIVDRERASATFCRGRASRTGWLGGDAFGDSDPMDDGDIASDFGVGHLVEIGHSGAVEKGLAEEIKLVDGFAF
jgi:hypothetical protein